MSRYYLIQERPILRILTTAETKREAITTANAYSVQYGTIVSIAKEIEQHREGKKFS